MTNEEILDSMGLCPAGGANNIVLRAMDAARKDEAESFAVWIIKEGWLCGPGTYWVHKYEIDENKRYTISELYQRFKIETNGNRVSI